MRSCVNRRFLKKGGSLIRSAFIQFETWEGESPAEPKALGPY